MVEIKSTLRVAIQKNNPYSAATLQNILKIIKLINHLYIKVLFGLQRKFIFPDTLNYSDVYRINK